MQKQEKKYEYIYKYDPIVRRRVVHVVIGKCAISLVTGRKVRLRR